MKFPVEGNSVVGAWQPDAKARAATGARMALASDEPFVEKLPAIVPLRYLRDGGCFLSMGISR
jgi:hypothetical protein